MSEARAEDMYNSIGFDAESAEFGFFSDLNIMFVLLSGYLVFFMQCGFAMLSAGSVRSKNVANILLKNLLDACIGALGWYLTGYAFAFGGGGKFIGAEKFYALHDLPREDYGMWFFQYAFTATAATIVSGAVAGRTRFEAYLLYAVFLSMWVYPVVVHWVWSEEGFLSAFRASDLVADSGMIDFAGCGVVHMVGGFAGLAGAAVVGPRIGRFDQDGKAKAIPGHNISLVVLGVFILWFGWFGFNPGSALVIIDAGTIVATCAVNTTLSAAAGTITCLFFEMAVAYVSDKRIIWDLTRTSNGALAGLVAITASCSVVQSWAAIIIGIIGGLVYSGACRLVLYVFKVDDPLDAVAVHGFCGMWGLIAVACFADNELMDLSYGFLEDSNGKEYSRPYGFIMGGNGSILAANLAGLLTIFAWVMGLMIPFFIILRFGGLLRVDKEEEIMGLDVSHHGGNAYPGDNGLKVEKISSDISEEHRATPGMVRELGSKMEALEQLVNQALGTQVQKEE